MYYTVRYDWMIVHIFLNSFDYYFCRYAQYGDVSPKIDVYAFGVVLYELISAKSAILKTGESVAESKGLVVLVGLIKINFTSKTLRKIIINC
jgi:chitin elicitor receptor kinase 1